MRVGRLIVAAGWAAAWAAAGLGAAPAGAQVTTNSGALDALGNPGAPAHHPAPRRAPPRAVAAKPTPAPNPAPTPTPTPTPAKLPTVPVTPPAILAMPPAVAVPLAHPPPMPTIPVADDAPGDATPIQGGLRITFGADRADLNPATVKTLHEFAEQQADRSLSSINIYAYAAGSPDDPSTPRRLSLERALAARAVLMNAGIPSPRIYPRALGPLGGATSPDRVDVVAGSPTPAPVPSPTGPGRAG